MSKFDPIFDNLKPVFKTLKFRKRGNTFYGLCKKSTVVVNFQGSTNGTHFYVNFGSKVRIGKSVSGKITVNEMKSVHPSTRIDLFEDTQGWLYTMCKTESGILARKIIEHIELIANS